MSDYILKLDISSFHLIVTSLKKPIYVSEFAEIIHSLFCGRRANADTQYAYIELYMY